MSYSAAIAGHDPLGQYRHLAVLSGSRQPIPLSATRFSVRILGSLALVTAERQFRNAERRSIEATLTFPVPVHAALAGLSAQIGERRLLAQTRSKAQARKSYETAIDPGKTAVLHEEVLRGIHMISVGHVPPGQTVTVQGLWVMPLAARGDGLVLSIPTTVGDIYGRSPLPDSDDLIHAAVLHEAELAVSCDQCHAALAQGGLLQGRARVRLDAPIEILVTGAAVRPLHGMAADGRTVQLSVTPAAGGDNDLDLVLLQDTSGSMWQPASGRDDISDRAASKHEVALRGLAEAAARLRHTDRIDVWAFSDTAHHLGSGVGPAAVAQALAMIEQPNGGTELQPAIEAVLARRGEADVLLVTDGKSFALDVHAMARRGARFTVVLVGEDSLAANVGHLAALSGGQIFVSSGLDLPEVLRQAIASMRALRLRQEPVLPGTPVLTAAALAGGMRIEATWSDSPSAHLVPTDEANRAIAAYAAWLALPRLDEAAAAALAEAEGVVCHLTSMVLVDEVGEAQEGLPAQRKVPLMTPRTAGPVGVREPLAHSAMLPMTSASPPPDMDLAVLQFSLRAMPRDASLLREDSAPKPPSRLARVMRRLRPSSPTPSRSKIDWSGDPEALRRGEWDGLLPPDIIARLREAAKRPEVQQLAAALGFMPELVALALLAQAEAASDRGAARFARMILRAADRVTMDNAAQAARFVA
jgi:hypothetical protein